MKTVSYLATALVFMLVVALGKALPAHAPPNDQVLTLASYADHSPITTPEELTATLAMLGAPAPATAAMSPQCDECLAQYYRDLYTIERLKGRYCCPTPLPCPDSTGKLCPDYTLPGFCTIFAQFLEKWEDCMEEYALNKYLNCCDVNNCNCANPPPAPNIWPPANWSIIPDDPMIWPPHEGGGCPSWECCLNGWQWNMFYYYKVYEAMVANCNAQYPGVLQNQQRLDCIENARQVFVNSLEGSLDVLYHCWYHYRFDGIPDPEGFPTNYPYPTSLPFNPEFFQNPPNPYWAPLTTPNWTDPASWTPPGNQWPTYDCGGPDTYGLKPPPAPPNNGWIPCPPQSDLVGGGEEEG